LHGRKLSSDSDPFGPRADSSHRSRGAADRIRAAPSLSRKPTSPDITIEDVRTRTYIDYHMVSDEPQYIAYDRMTKIGRSIRDYVADVANLSHRPVVDQPKPEPNGLCRQ